MSSAAVVIPHYQSGLDATQRVSLGRCAGVLGAHPLILLLPQSVDAAALLALAPRARIERFDDACFADVRAYNRLLLDDAFYARFAAFDYILVHQLDAFVFRDELGHWCARGFDYIGAPWLRVRPARGAADALRLRFKGAVCRQLDLREGGSRAMHYAQFQSRVGNGGFSLRRVEALRRVLRDYRHRLAPYRDYRTMTHAEDMFFAVEVNRHRRALRIPDAAEAAHFAWELQPQTGAALTGGALPFGCHAWERLHREFWRPVFAAQGIDLDALNPLAAA